jgi:hypothetical protein
MLGADTAPNIGAEFMPEGRAPEAPEPKVPAKLNPAAGPPAAFKGSCWALAFIQPSDMAQTAAPIKARKSEKWLLSNFMNLARLLKNVSVMDDGQKLSLRANWLRGPLTNC